MALIVLQHVVADQYPVATTWSGDLIAGSLVALDTDGNISLPTTSAGPIGIAGDTISTATGGTAYAVDLVISPAGGTRYTQNRVSDFYDETKASGYITVYTGGGKFATDQYNTGGSYVPGTPLWAEDDGDFTDSVGSSDLARVVGYTAKAPTAYPSGVPGTDVEGSMTLGNFLTVILAISGAV